jgi:hypothetical protein
MSSRRRFATPARSFLREYSPYRGNVRRESLGIVHRSRAFLCRPVPNPNSPMRNQQLSSLLSLSLSLGDGPQVIVGGTALLTPADVTTLLLHP